MFWHSQNGRIALFFCSRTSHRIHSDAFILLENVLVVLHNDGMFRLCFLALLILLSSGATLFADTFETRMGKTVEGEIISEDRTYLYLDTPSEGTINVRKMDILTVNGEPYHYMGQGTAPINPEKSTVKQPIYLGPMSQEDRELSDLPEPGANIAVQFNGPENGQNKPVTVSGQGKPKTFTMIHPSGVTEEELKEYYRANKENFRMALQIRLKFINPPALNGPPAEILKNPASSRSWQDAGWFKKGDTFNAPFSEAAYEKIFGLKKGSAAMVRDENGAEYLFWATARKEAYVLPYEQARPKILTKILQQKTRQASPQGTRQ